jgi:hypothetical protein
MRQLPQLEMRHFPLLRLVNTKAEKKGATSQSLAFEGHQAKSERPVGDRTLLSANP